IDTNIIITTIHGAKGLEWQYVFLPDTERWIFPSYHTCNNCVSKYSSLKGCKCVLSTPIDANTKMLLLDELSVFYVGVTRARKQVYVSASAYRYNASNELKSSGFSCMVGMSGIKLINAKVD
ncbi:MAG: ATP-dependent helicase, partial [Clostridia bacterium]|nr:ATP-dependent helicase [Clostridia bacterium]